MYYGFAGVKVIVACMVRMILITRDKSVHYQLNIIPEKTHSCC